MSFDKFHIKHLNTGKIHCIIHKKSIVGFCIIPHIKQ